MWWRARRKPMKPIGVGVSAVLRSSTKKGKKKEEKTKRKIERKQRSQAYGGKGRRMEAVPPPRKAVNEEAASLNDGSKSKRKRERS